MRSDQAVQCRSIGCASGPAATDEAWFTECAVVVRKGIDLRIAEITRHRIHDRAVAAAVAERAQLRREIGRVLAGKPRKPRCPRSEERRVGTECVSTGSDRGGAT